MKLTFIQKSVYGKTLFYPIGAESKSICKVANQKTMSENDLNVLNDGGFEIEIKQAGLQVFVKNADNNTKKVV